MSLDPFQKQMWLMAFHSCDLAIIFMEMLNWQATKWGKNQVYNSIMHLFQAWHIVPVLDDVTVCCPFYSGLPGIVQGIHIFTPGVRKLNTWRRIENQFWESRRTAIILLVRLDYLMEFKILVHNALMPHVFLTTESYND